MPTEVQQVIDQTMRDPIKVEIKYCDRTLEGVKQFYALVEHESLKFETLCVLLEKLKHKPALIFTNTRQKAERLTDLLAEKGFKVGVIHPEMSKTDSELVMRSLRNSSIQVLVETDSFDCNQWNLVFNYDLPINHDLYLYRNGRSGCYGRRSLAICITTREEKSQLLEIEGHLNTKISELPEGLSDF
jgi:translation initiation factor 4A